MLGVPLFNKIQNVTDNAPPAFAHNTDMRRQGAGHNHQEIQMLEFRRRPIVILAASALAVAVTIGVSLGQNAPQPQIDKVPSGPTPLHAPMPALTPEEVLKRQGRGGGGGGGGSDYNTSRRSDFDKALPNPYAVN